MTDRSVVNTRGLSRELLLMLDLLPEEADAAAVLRRLDATHGINWEHFVELTLHHRVYPYLYPRLAKAGDAVPPAALQRLKREYQRNTLQMLQLSGEMGALAEALAGRSIRSLFLKGPVLAQELYGDLSLRTSRDLDFLVPMEDLEQAEALLVELGYVKEEDFESVLGDWKWRQHHNTYQHPVTRVTAEIHWRLSPAPSKEPKFDALWERSRISPLGRHVRYLGPEDLFMYLAVHGARHGWSRLRWLMDIDRLLGREPGARPVGRRPDEKQAGQGPGVSQTGRKSDAQRPGRGLEARQTRQETNAQRLDRRPPDEQLPGRGLDAQRLTQLLAQYRCEPAAGQALLLASGLLHTPVEPELASLASHPKAQKMAELAMFYVERMVNLHHPPLPPEVDRHYKAYQPAILSPGQRVLYLLGFLHPYAADARTLPLPKPLHVLYFPLRPFLWTWRKAVGQKE